MYNQIKVDSKAPQRLRRLIVIVLFVVVFASVARWLLSVNANFAAREVLEAQQREVWTNAERNDVTGWSVADACKTQDGHLVVTITVTKNLGVSTFLEGSLSIFYLGQQVLSHKFHDEFLDSNVGSRSIILRTSNKDLLEDFDLADFLLEWSPR